MSARKLVNKGKFVGRFVEEETKFGGCFNNIVVEGSADKTDSLHAQTNVLVEGSSV